MQRISRSFPATDGTLLPSKKHNMNMNRRATLPRYRGPKLKRIHVSMMLHNRLNKYFEWTKSTYYILFTLTTQDFRSFYKFQLSWKNLWHSPYSPLIMLSYKFSHHIRGLWNISSGVKTFPTYENIDSAKFFEKRNTINIRLWMFSDSKIYVLTFHLARVYRRKIYNYWFFVHIWQNCEPVS